MLENFVFPQIAAEVDSLIFQQDGAPAHFGGIVHTALDDFLVNGSADKGQLIGPPWSPDLTLMDFFFWGYIKDTVQSERVETVPNFRRITVACAAVAVDVLSWVWGEVEFRFGVCRAVNGAHIELH
jgi:hypothetical protein